MQRCYFQFTLHERFSQLHKALEKIASYVLLLCVQLYRQKNTVMGVVKHNSISKAKLCTCRKYIQRAHFYDKASQQSKRVCRYCPLPNSAGRRNVAAMNERSGAATAGTRWWCFEICVFMFLMQRKNIFVDTGFLIEVFSFYT